MVADLLSIIVPAYNARPFLADALECIPQQGYKPVEVIVVDDGSTDGTGDVATTFGGEVTCVRQDNQGAAAARNHGLRLARGEMIAFIDADDLWPQGTLKELATYLRNHPKTELVVGRVQYMRSAARVNGKHQFEPYADPCLALNLGAALFRREVFDRVGQFNEGLRSSEDIDWFMRAREHGTTMFFLDRVTLFYRRHDSNMTLGREATHTALVRALKRSLDRRRRIGNLASLQKLLSDSNVSCSNSQRICDESNG